MSGVTTSSLSLAWSLRKRLAVKGWGRLGRRIGWNLFPPSFYSRSLYLRPLSFWYLPLKILLEGKMREDKRRSHLLANFWPRELYAIQHNTPSFIFWRARQKGLLKGAQKMVEIKSHFLDWSSLFWDSIFPVLPLKEASLYWLTFSWESSVNPWIKARWG